MKALIFVVILFSLWSCTNPVIYKSDININENGWSYRDTLKYNFSSHNIHQNYNLLISLKYSNTYAYSNLYIFVDVVDPENKKLRDTIECIMAAPSGRWLGNSSGDYLEHRFVYRYNINFPKEGEYQIKFQQAMRDTILKEILAVGIELRNFEEKVE